MLNRKLSIYVERVYALAAILGNSPAKIADALLKEVFPDTVQSAEKEGCDKMLRTGVIQDVRRIITSPILPEVQGDFSDVDPAFRLIVERLHRGTYNVPSLGEYLPVADLIRAPDLLDEARKHLRAHGEATLAEASVLDELYAAVTA